MMYLETKVMIEIIFMLTNLKEMRILAIRVGTITKECVCRIRMVFHFVSVEVISSITFVTNMFRLRMFLLFLGLPLFDISIYPCLHPCIESWIWFISNKLEDLQNPIISNPPCFNCQRGQVQIYMTNIYL